MLWLPSRKSNASHLTKNVMYIAYVSYVACVISHIRHKRYVRYIRYISAAAWGPSLALFGEAGIVEGGADAADMVGIEGFKLEVDNAGVDLG